MSCLFNSLSYFIKDTSFNIRQKICDYIEQNKPLIDGIETKDIIKYEGTRLYWKNAKYKHVGRSNRDTICL